MDPQQLVVSVEHASCRVPAPLRGLGLPPAHLRTHHGWDPGAADVARRIAKVFGSPLHLGRWSRLVADLNRSSFHPRVIARTSGGRAVPANQGLSAAARRARLDRYWVPYRSAVETDLDAVVARWGRVLHLSVHSFTPELDGEVRNNDIGLLYQPSRRAEKSLADRLDRRLSGRELRVRRNYPYTGLADGFCMRLRAERSARSYLGMEIELNQRALGDAASRRWIATVLIDALAGEFAR
ncbi:MAG: N-formylglutamate amidohydrolase [Planctomycetes bacterium]|nr:N-formylglutamate amidohydrolase [Planctomycetota bacterium]